MEGSSVTYPQLFYEAKCLKVLQGVPGIPAIFWSGVEGEFNVLILEFLGPNLQDLLSVCGGRFSIKTTVLLGIQILDILKCIQAKGFVHRDIKPENICLGQGVNSGKVYLIDFGLSKRYLSINDAIFGDE